ncbi:MAG: DUF1552 domain-containing protein [Verrucomicrobiales bacterium]
MKNEIPRRSFLRGMGALIALPALECMRSGAGAAGTFTGKSAGGAPVRMAFVYSPNGRNMPLWTPQGLGESFELKNTLSPLAKYKSELQVLSGLDHDKARPNGDGGGDHARANATFLTGCQAKKTSGADIRIGVSVDQLAAERLGDETLLRSLEMSCDQARQSGGCDSGYACAYQYNLSWKSERTPMAPEHDPRAVFERLFGGAAGRGSAEERARRAHDRKSVLDYVMDDANRLNKKLGNNDRHKVDEYLTAVREMEQRIEKAEKMSKSLPDSKVPDGVPKNYSEHIRSLYDLMVLAFQSDSTRVASFMMAHDGSNRSFSEISVPEGHHHISHHNRDPRKLEQIAKIDKFYVEQFAYFMGRLRETKDIDGQSLLDNSMIVFGSGIADPDRHSHDDLPLLLAGGGGGTLNPGRHVRFDGNVPLTNLYLSMLDRVGVHADRVGDSDGRLPNI